MNKGADAKKTETTWKRSTSAAHASRITIGDREELPLRGMQLKVTVDGFRARVVLDGYFVNDRGLQYEGNFQLRLPDEASPYFFAFGETKFVASDVPAKAIKFFTVEEERKMGASPSLIMSERLATWTQPKEARIVPKEKAAFAYAQTVRGNTDPALLEWAGAGVFNARVFPLAPHKIHRVVVGYDAPLVEIGDELEYKLELPQGTDNVFVDVSASAPPSSTTPSAPVASEASRWWVHLERPKDPAITLRFKRPTAPLLTGSDGKTAYFATSVKPQLPATDAASATSDTAVLLVDTSLSSNPDRFNVWLKLARSILAENRATLKRFNALFFNVETKWYRNAFVENTPENVQAFLDYASGLALEGATDLGAALKQAMRPSWLDKGGPGRWDTFLLSDGAATWGEANAVTLARAIAQGERGALFAYQTGMAGTDVGALSQLARESGGAVFSVVGESEVAKAATAHRSRPWRLVGAKVTGGSDVLVAGRPRAIFPGQSLVVAGRGAPPAGAELELTVEQNGVTRTIKTPLGAPLASEQAPRLYGQIAVGQLEELGDATEPLAKSYSVHFRVTGRTCSLLMLESEADYQRYNIRPQEDEQVVRTQPAGDAVAAALKAMGNRLSDPKASFLAWLESMQRMPGMIFAIDQRFRRALVETPAAAFEIPSAGLDTRSSLRADVPGSVRDLLSSHKLDYDAIASEALRRKYAYGSPDALKALSSLVEENPGDAVLSRDVAFSALEWGEREQAVHLLGRVAASRPYEPQTYRAMANTLASMGKSDLAVAYYELALGGRWDGRFGDFEQILAVDYLRFLKRTEPRSPLTAYARARMNDVSRAASIPDGADLVVMITWNTDDSDVDLHVVEPSGEECYYGHRATRAGGRLTRDVTQGFGPEMYVLPRRSPGTFQIRAKYFASERNRATARTKVYATVIEGWGTKNERVTEKVVTLVEDKEMHDIATVVR
jgi:Mg-chelatase subunit ChlD